MFHEKRFGEKCPGCGDRLEFDENLFGKCFHCLQVEDSDRKKQEEADRKKQEEAEARAYEEDLRREYEAEQRLAVEKMREQL